MDLLLTCSLVFSFFSIFLKICQIATKMAISDLFSRNNRTANTWSNAFAAAEEASSGGSTRTETMDTVGQSKAIIHSYSKKGTNSISPHDGSSDQEAATTNDSSHNRGTKRTTSHRAASSFKDDLSVELASGGLY
jgi:hypothetical protein